MPSQRYGLKKIGNSPTCVEFPANFNNTCEHTVQKMKMKKAAAVEIKKLLMKHACGKSIALLLIPLTLSERG